MGRIRRGMKGRDRLVVQRPVDLANGKTMEAQIHKGSSNGDWVWVGASSPEPGISYPIIVISKPDSEQNPRKKKVSVLISDPNKEVQLRVV